MNIRNFFFACAMVFGAATASAQNTPEGIIEKFFLDYEKRGPHVAVDELYKTNPWTARITDAVENVKTQLARFDENLVGPYYGYEPITRKKVGESHALYSYFLKFDRQFLRLTFQFYKPNDAWRLYSFEFEDNYSEELKDAARLYYVAEN